MLSKAICCLRPYTAFKGSLVQHINCDGFFRCSEVPSADGAKVSLDLPETFGKAHGNVTVNIRRLKFYEERDSCFGEADGRPEPLITSGCVARYEVSRISNDTIHKGQAECGLSGRATISHKTDGCIGTS